MDPVERAQERAEADFVSEVYGLLDAQSRLVLAMLRKQTDRPLSDPRAQRLLAAIVSEFVSENGTFHKSWVEVLGVLYLGMIGTSAKLLRNALPNFTITGPAAVEIARDAALARAATQAGFITQTIAADLARVVNQAAMIAVPGDAAPAIGDVVVGLQGAMLAPNALDSRAQRIAGTEAPGWLNQSRALLVATDGTYTKNTWRTQLDEAVRITHAMQEGMTLPINTPFPNGCRYPGDPDADISETARCRCYCDYS